MPKALLAILDGFGIAENKDVSAIDRADISFFKHLESKYPHSRLAASGEEVGLPEGQFGNSEVGHLNLGAGRIVWQELSRVNKDIREGGFYTNEVLVDAVTKAKEKNKIHIMGLFSDGGVHSHNEHLFALLKLCKKHNIENVYVHAFMDGRDTSPNGGLKYAEEFENQAREIGVGELASIVGRYYAMDRDKRWERIKLCYDLLTEGKGNNFSTAKEAIKTSYDDKVTDEFIKPITIGDASKSRVQENDVVLFYNIRGDRAREITVALSDPNFEEFETKNLNLQYYSFTQYAKEYSWVNVAYPPVNLVNTLGEVVSQHKLKQLRIAETEKYPHVTYFFNGGVEHPNEGEDRLMVPSPKVATYDLQPEMSAPEMTEKLCAKIDEDIYDLVILNFANPDMVGHTGDMNATIKAVETVDKCLKDVVEAAISKDYRVVVIADHGNADKMIEDNGEPHTAHTTSLVPCIVINEKNISKLEDGKLADVAPTLLKLMGISQPKEMTGKALF